MPIIVQSIFSRCLAIVMVLSAGLVLTLADGAKAQLRIEITEGQVAPTPIAIAEFTGPDGNVTEVGRQLTQIISDDLESSGLFRPVDSAAALSTGRNRPELSKSSEIICVNWRPTSVTLPSGPVNSAIAIGVGATCPSVISMRNCALAPSARVKTRPADKTITIARHREKIDCTIIGILIIYLLSASCFGHGPTNAPQISLAGLIDLATLHRFCHRDKNRGSNTNTKRFHCSYFSGGNGKGEHSRVARMASSAATL